VDLIQRRAGWASQFEGNCPQRPKKEINGPLESRLLGLIAASIVTPGTPADAATSRQSRGNPSWQSNRQLLTWAEQGKPVLPRVSFRTLPTGNGSAPRPGDFLAVAQNRAHAADRDGQERHAGLRRDEEAADLERKQAGRAMKGHLQGNDETLAGSRGAGGGLGVPAAIKPLTASCSEPSPPATTTASSRLQWRPRRRRLVPSGW
jgi:hypothetical protein